MTKQFTGIHGFLNVDISDRSLVGSDILNKNLKPIASPNTASANAQIDKDLSQLKTAIDNKAPFIDIMKIVIEGKLPSA
jgi:hypothetical protein